MLDLQMSSAESTVTQTKRRTLPMLRNVSQREYLYDLDSEIEVRLSLLTQQPEIASRLRSKLADRATELEPPSLDSANLSKAAQDYFDFYLDGKPPTLKRTAAMTRQKQTDRSRNDLRRPKRQRNAGQEQ